ncbi:MAG TPA: RlmE family RNA methyltransferase [Pelomicrobium sp.]|nr:RlmE family RNA methyltransferase [Pelomicrobium sp.]
MAKGKTSKAWMRQHVTDPYVKQARKEGYRSRAAYKLLELDARDRLLAPGAVVVDLGSTPGGWSQVVAEKVGPRGRVVAIDLIEMAVVPGVTFVQADFREADGLARLEAALGGGAVDLVLSDMAPNLSGIAEADQARTIHLAELALEFAEAHLKPGGAMLVKTFQGGGFAELVKAMRVRFLSVAVRKPQASRSASSEVYLVGKGFRAASRSG